MVNGEAVFIGAVPPAAGRGGAAVYDVINPLSKDNINTSSAEVELQKVRRQNGARNGTG